MNNSKVKIAIVIPAFNEEASIGDVVTAFRSELPDALICVVDNNSTDKTKERCLDVFNVTNSSNNLYLFEKRPGKGRAIKRAFETIVADIYVMVDADLTYPATEIHKLINPVLKGSADMVVGERFSLGTYEVSTNRAMHTSGNALITSLVRLMFGGALTDVLSGYRVFNKKFIDSWVKRANGFEVEMEATLHALASEYIVEEMAIKYGSRVGNSVSKLNTFSDGFRIVKTMLVMYANFKPLPAFGGIGLAFLIAGLTTGYPVVSEFIETAYITHVPLAILSTGLCLMAFLFFFAAIILDAINQTRKHVSILFNNYTR